MVIIGRLIEIGYSMQLYSHGLALTTALLSRNKEDFSKINWL